MTDHRTVPTPASARSAAGTRVRQGADTAELVGNTWRSDNASFALWLNSIAPDVETAVNFGCAIVE